MAKIQYTAPKAGVFVLALAASSWSIPTNGRLAAQESFSDFCECTVVEPFAENTQFVVDAKAAQWIKFQRFVQQWRIERGAMSSITEMAMLRPYQNIIGMGEDAIPLIIAELRSEGDEPDQWFWALRAITGANPVAREDQGDVGKMAQAWFKWAEEEGYAG